MSPSRIPRTALPPSPLGPGTSKSSDLAAHGPTPSRLPQPCSPNVSKSPRTVTTAQSCASALPVPRSRRRPKPPSDEDLPWPRRQTSALAPQSPKRRPVPQVGTDEETGIPRLGTGPRKILRQPASSANLSANAFGNISRPVGRNRAKSAAASTTQPKAALASSPVLPGHSASNQSERTGATPQVKTYLFESSFLESREPSVPGHIASRLKLIHQLGVVLGVDAKVLQGSIDIPGLLRRVDVAYEKGFGAYTPGDESVGLGRRGSNASATSLPIPTPMSSSASSQGRISMDFKDGRVSMDGRPGTAAANNGGKKRFGIFKRFSKNRSTDPTEVLPVVSDLVMANDNGPVLGTALTDAPEGSWCTSLIGGHRHDLPLVVFTIVEEIYRRGMSEPGIFRLAGEGSRLSELIDIYNMAPLYGDTQALDGEPIHNLTGLIKRYVRDLPEPILDEAIFPALTSFCTSDSPVQTSMPDQTKTSEETRIMAAQILLQLLPPPHFSLLVYLLAFLGQLPLFPDNRLNVDSISIIFGPAICAPRGRGISGLGPAPVGRGSDASEAERISALVDDSQVVLSWLLRNWPKISEKVLDAPREPAQHSYPCSDDGSSYDPRLLSPIDLRGQTSEDSPYAKSRAAAAKEATRPVHTTSPAAPSSNSVIATPHHRWSSMGALYPQVVSSELPHLSRPRSSTSSTSPSPSFGLGLFHRARSSSNLQAAYRGSMYEPGSSPMLGTGKAKRSASFTSLSSLLKMGGTKSGNGQSKQQSGDSSSGLHTQTPLTSPQIHSVLDSLHDLLISKDKQIERDARELALLRHTLLEMDEKLQRLSTSPEPGGGGSYLSSLHQPGSAAMSPHSSAGSQPYAYSRCSSTPSILVTSSTSSHQIAAHTALERGAELTDTNEKDRQLAQLQDQLNSKLALLDAARVQNRDTQGRLYDLESRLALSEAERKAEMGRVELQLTIEQSRVRGLIEERDLARDRLEKVKSTLFAVG